MRKCKIIELLKSPDIDLTDEELNIFLLRLNYYNDGVSEKVGKCPRSITTIFMNVLNKIRDFKNEKRVSITARTQTVVAAMRKSKIRETSILSTWTLRFWCIPGLFRF